jgi:hypothetical protein
MYASERLLFKGKIIYAMTDIKRKAKGGLKMQAYWGKFPIGCHSCTSGKFVGRMNYKENFDREKYEDVIQCENCGAEVRQLKGEKLIESERGG